MIFWENFRIAFKAIYDYRSPTQRRSTPLGRREKAPLLPPSGMNPLGSTLIPSRRGMSAGLMAPLRPLEPARP